MITPPVPEWGVKVRRSSHFLVSALAAGLLTVGASKPALALNHVNALRSGKMIVAVSTKSVFAVPPNLRAAILPVLIGSPGAPSEVHAYFMAEKQLQSAANNEILKPYAGQIRTLPLSRDTLSAGREAAPLIKWIRRASLVDTYRGESPLGGKEMQAIAFAGDTDAVAFLQPIVVFTSGFKRVYVIATVTVYAWGPVHAFYMGSINLHASTSLNGTKPVLKTYGVESLATSDRTGKIASEARAQIWFSDNSLRLNEAIDEDMQKLRKQIISYLSGD